MFGLKIKKIISILLVVAMIFTSTGFATFADSIDDMTKASSENNEKASSSKYYDEFIEEQISDTVANLPDGSQEFDEPEESEVVGADTIRPSNVEEDTVGADIIRPSTDDTVGADTIRPSNVEDESITVDEKREDERSTKETSDGYVEASDGVVETSDDFVEVEHCETTYRMGELSEPEESDTVVADTIRPSNVEEDTVVADTIRPSNVEEIKEDAMIEASSAETSTTIKPVENEEVINQDFNLESEVANVSTYSELSEPTEIEDEKNIITSATFSEIENINNNKDIAQNISTNSIIENEEIENDISTYSDISNKVNIKIATESTNEKLFGAPVDYVLPKDWYSTSRPDSYSYTGIVREIRFAVPGNLSLERPIPNSNGLYARTVVRTDTNGRFDTIYIYAKNGSTAFMPNKIYAAEDSSYMFGGTQYNTLKTFYDPNHVFDTSRVRNMSYMFDGWQSAPTSAFPVQYMDTSNVTDMSGMFYNCRSLTTLDLSSFNTSNVTTMNAMFYNCQSLTTLDLSSFDTSNVTDIGSMFMQCQSLTILDLFSFDTHNVVEIARMFNNCTALTTIIASSSFATTAVTSDGNMFSGCNVLAGGNGTTFANKSGEGSAQTDKTYARIDGFNGLEGYFTAPVDYILPTNWADTFTTQGYAKNTIKNITFEKAPTVAPATSLFNATIPSSNGLELYVTQNTLAGYYDITIYAPTYGTIYAETDASNLFSMYSILESINNLSYLDTRNVTNMNGMFYDCDGLTTIDLRSFNTSNVTDMGNMFNSCNGLTAIDLTSFDTSNVTNMSNMFCYCQSLQSLDLSSFNTSNVTDMSQMFMRCEQLSTLNLSNFDTHNVLDMNTMFASCISLTSLDISNFNTESVASMSYMFHDLQMLNALDISSFNTNNVTSMEGMFAECLALETIVASPSFVTTTVVDDSDMFLNSTNLRGGAGTTYASKSGEGDAQTNKTYAKIDRVGDPGYFTESAYTLPNTWYDETLAGTTKGYVQSITISKYPTPAPTTYTHDYEITGSNGLHVYANVTGSGTSQRSDVTIYAPADKTIYAAEDSSLLFYGYGRITNLDLSLINTSNVSNMSGMFYYCQALTSLDLSNFNTSNVTDMSSMFGSCRALTSLDLSSFNTSNVTNMDSMFHSCRALTSLDLSSFNTSNVTDMTAMFFYCQAITTIIASTSFVTTAVTSHNQMFENCQVLEGGNGTKYSDRYAANSTTADNKTYAKIDRVGDPGYFTESGSSDYILPNTWYNGTSAGAAKANVQSITISKYPTPAPTTYTHDYEITGSNGLHVYANVTGSGTSQRSDVTIYAPEDKTIYAPEDSTNLFGFFEQVEIINNLSYLDTSNVTTMKEVFKGCNALATIDVSNFDTSSVTDMGDMFSSCNSLTTIDVSHFDTSNVTNMYQMFSGCNSLTAIDVSNFDTRNVTSMYCMFSSCNSLTSIDVTHFDTSNVTNMGGMFSNCQSVTSLDVTNFNTSNVTMMSGMFRDCSLLTTLDISNFDTRNVVYVGEMFARMTNLTTIIASSSFVTTSVTYDNNMFIDCTALTGGAGTTYSNKYTLDQATAINKTFAYIDGLHGIDGYFTSPAQYSGVPGGDGTSVNSIRIISSPSKIDYQELEYFDPTGLVIGVTWDDGYTNTITYNDNTKRSFTFNPATTSELTISDTNVEITYAGVSANLPLTVSATYNITWDLYDGTSDELIDRGTWSNIVGTTTYTYGTGLTTLPDTNDVIPPEGRNFDHWKIIYTGSGDPDLEPATNVGITTWGNITIKAVYTNISYNITWTLGEGNFIIANEASPSYTYGTTWPLPEAKQINAPIGQKLDYWTIRQGVTDITHATSISKTTYGDVEIIAVYKFAPYDIIWDLGDGSFKDATIATMSYSYGDTWSLPNANTIKEPAGREFDHWIIRKYGDADIDPAAILPSTIYGDIEIIATYRNLSYNILWDLYDGTSTELIDRGTWSNTVGTITYTYGTGLNSFPEVLPPRGRNFDHWKIMHTESGDPDLDPATSVSTTTWGNITIKAVYTNETYNIIWDLGDGKWKGSEGIDHYTYGTEITLPTNVTPPTGKTFNGWTINGETITKITNDSVGDITIVAVYKNKPSSGDDDKGGSGSSGGSSSGGSTKGTININQNTTELGMVFITPIQNNEYKWERSVDLKNKSYWIVKVLKTTSLAKVLMSSRDYAIYYKDIDENYIQIKNGIYCLQYLNQYYYFAFDFNGNMLTGIINTSDNTKQWTIDTTNGKLVESKFVGKAKYYFYDGVGNLYGVMWNQPITIYNIQYTFDTNGKIIKETTISTENVLSSGTRESWQYDAVTNKWKFATIGSSGQMNYYKNGMYPIISANGEINYYIFDENGELVS